MKDFTKNDVIALCVFVSTLIAVGLISLAATNIDEFKNKIPEWIMASAAILSLILNIIVIFLLKRTLFATEATVREAENARQVQLRIGTAQMRPWLTLDAELGSFSRNKSKNSASVESCLTIENKGNMPAYEVSISTTLLQLKGFQFWENIIQRSIVDLPEKYAAYRIMKKKRKFFTIIT